MGKRTILQPTALKVLFSVNTRTYYRKAGVGQYIYAYRFAVATGLRPGELIGLWYGDIKGTRSTFGEASTCTETDDRKKRPQSALLTWARKLARHTRHRCSF